MTRRTLALLAAVVLCFGLTGCIGRTGPTAAHPIDTTPTTTAPIPLKSVGLAPAAASVTDRIVLTKHNVRAGTTIAGTLIVTNTSPNPINLTETCEPAYAVVVQNRAIRQEPAFTASCSSQPLILHPGTNRFPIAVATTYFGCLQPGGSSVTPMPKCTANGPQPLPVGIYRTVLYGSGDLALPEPAPIVVALRAGRP